MDPCTATTAHRRGQQIHKGGYIVIGDRFSLGHGIGTDAWRSPDSLGCFAWGNADLCPSLDNEGFDLFPDVELVLLRPDGRHLGEGIALNHSPRG